MPRKRTRSVPPRTVPSPQVSTTARERSLVPSDPLHRYLAEIRRFPLLTAEEEHDLAVRWRRDKDRAAAYRLATGNLRLVVHIALDFRRSTLNLMDLIQEGNIGLMQAVQRFDPFRAIRFSAYASWWIRAYILKFIIDHWSLVRVSTTNERRKLFFNLKREKVRLEALGIRPQPSLLAERLGTSEQDVIDVQQAVEGRDLSISAPLRGDSDTALLDVLPARQAGPEEEVAEAQYHALLRRKFEEFALTLPAREQGIFRRRLIADEPETLQQIGDSFGVTREAVRQMEKRVVEKLRRYLVRELADVHGVHLTPEVG
jgi:RNA polymerase sigma-32 factor